MTSTRTPFRAGAGEAPARGSTPDLLGSGPSVLLADCSEFQPSIADAAYLRWSEAIVVRATYGAVHDDRAWYGGQRRQALHDGGVRFLGIYAYLVASQPAAAQAQAFHDLVGALRPGEVLIADYEEGARSQLTGFYNEMSSLYGQAILPHLWTYSGLWFGQANGVLPVQWIAAYQDKEPATPHTLWQFTSDYEVPGVGVADCSVYRGPIAQLAALAYQPAPKPVPGPLWPAAMVLREGDTGPAVTVLQRALSEIDLRGVRGIKVDGTFGPQTLVALRNFQSAEHLAVDGIAGPQVREALRIGAGA